jgi:hypothetical protein
MTEALEDLTQAVAERDEAESRQAALDVTRIGLDLSLRYRSRIEVDFARLDLWARQLVIDAEARDAAGVASDLAILKWVLDRLAQICIASGNSSAHFGPRRSEVISPPFCAALKPSRSFCGNVSPRTAKEMTGTIDSSTVPGT